jgi:hypothetical protein
MKKLLTLVCLLTISIFVQADEGQKGSVQGMSTYKVSAYDLNLAKANLLSSGAIIESIDDVNNVIFVKYITRHYSKMVNMAGVKDVERAEPDAGLRAELF